jgi:multidrug efflux pump
MLGNGYVNRFSLAERSYEVIPQVDRSFRLDPAMLNDYYLRAASGELVPLGNLVHFEDKVEPSKRTQFQQLNSLTVEGIMTPGVPLGDAIAYLELKSTDFC